MLNSQHQPLYELANAATNHLKHNSTSSKNCDMVRIIRDGPVTCDTVVRCCRRQSSAAQHHIDYVAVPSAQASVTITLDAHVLTNGVAASAAAAALYCPAQSFSTRTSAPRSHHGNGAYHSDHTTYPMGSLIASAAVPGASSNPQRPKHLP